MNPESSADRESTRGPYVRGHILRFLRGWVETRHGTEGTARLFASSELPPSSAAALRRAKGSEWLPAEAHTHALRALRASFGSGPEFFERLAEEQCSHDLASPIGWIYKLVAPRSILGHFDVVWRQFHSSGSWKCVPSEASVTLRLERWEGGSREACAMTRGALRTLLRQWTRIPDASVEELSCAFHPASTPADAACVYRMDQPLSRLQPVPFDTISSGDVPAIGLQLAQLGAFDDVASVLRRAIDVLLPDHHARLEIDDAGGRAGFTVWEVGDLRRPLRHQWPVDAGGAVIGRLSLEDRGSDAETVRRHVVSQLAPWAGVALQARRNQTGPAPPGPGVPLSWEERVEAAAEALELSPRLRDVLARVVLGESNRQIALTLGIAEPTVESHVARLLRAADVDGRTRLIAQVASGTWESRPDKPRKKR